MQVIARYVETFVLKLIENPFILDFVRLCTGTDDLSSINMIDYL